MDAFRDHWVAGMPRVRRMGMGDELLGGEAPQMEKIDD